MGIGSAGAEHAEPDGRQRASGRHGDCDPLARQQRRCDGPADLHPAGRQPDLCGGQRRPDQPQQRPCADGYGAGGQPAPLQLLAGAGLVYGQQRCPDDLPAGAGSRARSRKPHADRERPLVGHGQRPDGERHQRHGDRAGPEGAGDAREPRLRPRADTQQLHPHRDGEEHRQRAADAQRRHLQRQRPFTKHRPIDTERQCPAERHAHLQPHGGRCHHDDGSVPYQCPRGRQHGEHRRRPLLGERTAATDGERIYRQRGDCGAADEQHGQHRGPADGHQAADGADLCGGQL